MIRPYPLSVRFTEEEYDRLDRAAQARGLTVGTMIQVVLAKYVHLPASRDPAVTRTPPDVPTRQVSVRTSRVRPPKGRIPAGVPVTWWIRAVTLADITPPTQETSTTEDGSQDVPAAP